jgi:hypothetical protein
MKNTMSEVEKKYCIIDLKSDNITVSIDDLHNLSIEEATNWISENQEELEEPITIELFDDTFSFRYLIQPDDWPSLELDNTVEE